MTGLTYQQKEEITRLRAADMSLKDIAEKLGLEEKIVGSALRRRKLRGYFGLAGIFSFFTAIIITPFLNAEHLEGELISDVAEIQARLPGEWEGFWMSRGHKRPLRITFSVGAANSWSMRMIADDENCPGTGAYSGSGTITAKGIEGKLTAAHPDCGVLNIVYVMARTDMGKPQMKGEFLRMPTGDVGSHFLTRN